ncbi:MAG: hypothetical protein PHW02_02820 [bacterium]|nr:hypothetical protein [bacterium]
MKRIFAVLIILAVGFAAYPYTSLYDFSSGEMNQPLFGKATGAGNSDIFFNPAFNPSLMFSKDKYYVGVGFSGVSHRETRSEYIFDTYDNTVGKKNVYDNSFLYGEPSYIMGYMPLGVVSVSLGYENLLSKDYTYNKIYRDDNYVVLYNESQASIGNINGYFLSVSYAVWKIKTGLNVSILQGDGTNEYSIIYVDPSKTDSSYSIDEQYSGVRGGLGITYSPLKNLEITAVYHIQTIVKNQVGADYIGSDTISTAYDIDYILPNTAGIGVKYASQGRMPSTLMLNAVYERWTELNGGIAQYNDIIKYSAGVEHELTSSVNMLYGILYEPYKMDNQIADVGFTAGLSMKISQAEFTVSGQYRHMNYDKPKIEGDPESSLLFCTERVLRLTGDVTILF